MTECRLLLDPPCPGPWNMAVDEVLLDWAAAHGGCCWRFYGWQEPTLSLGYFQAHQDRREHAASRDCPAVRRLTGGGAILHDQELTYSIVVPGGHPLAAGRDLLYQVAHTSLIAVLGDLGMVARLCGTEDRRPAAAAGRGRDGVWGGDGHGDEPFCASSVARPATCWWAKPRSAAVRSGVGAAPCSSMAASCWAGRPRRRSLPDWVT